MLNWLSDDKNLVVISALLLGFAVIYSGPLDQSKAAIISSIFTGLFGIAVGRASK